MTDEEYDAIVPNNRDPNYGPGFLKFTELDHGWSNILFGHVLYLVFRPKRAIEFGCGTGGVLHGLRQNGVEVRGVEGSADCIPFIKRKDPVLASLVRIHDLRSPFPVQEPFDLAVSIEVLEHLPPESADTVVKTLCLSAHRLVVTACPPTGRNPKLHLNEQPIEYWLEKFAKLGFVPNDVDTAALRAIMRAFSTLYEAGRYPVIPAWFFSSSFVVFTKP